MTARIARAVHPAVRQLGFRRLHACAPPLRNAEIPASESSSQASQRSRVAEAKAKAWYLEEEDDVDQASGSRSSSTGPVFTTYNPMTTLPEPAADIPLQPLPQDVPDFARPLHAFLTENELFVPHSISFNRTKGSKASKSVAEFPNPQPERGKRRRSKSDSGEGIVIPGHEVGAFWDWVIVAQVAARGKGAVGRGERSIREFLHYNPMNGPARPRNPDKRPNLPRSNNPDSDWTLLDAGRGICINVMTAEGRERWGLEDAWKEST